MISILVTGANGQLGKCIQKIAPKTNFDFDFKTSQELDLTSIDSIENSFVNKNYSYVINCAAYTNVENSEKEPDKAYEVNAMGVKNLAKICKKNKVILIHISTDYVFDGTKNLPYVEEDDSNPLNEYGRSKLQGEQYISQIMNSFYIIRTSWLYSEFNKNFFKTIVNKSNTESQLTITTGETGTPTNANDLAKFLLEIINLSNSKYGIYHYSNIGEATWYDFAEEILRVSGKLKDIKLEKTDNYPTFAARPKYSVLNKEKSSNYFNSEILEWRESLKKLMMS